MLLVGERGCCLCLLLLLLLRLLNVWMGAGTSWRKRGRQFYDDERRTEERGGQKGGLGMGMGMGMVGRGNGL